MLCNTFQRRKLKERKEKILKDTKDGPGIQRESFGNSTDSEVLFVIASSVTSPLIRHNSSPCSVEDKYILKLGLERTFTKTGFTVSDNVVWLLVKVSQVTTLNSLLKKRLILCQSLVTH